MLKRWFLSGVFLAACAGLAAAPVARVSAAEAPAASPTVETGHAGSAKVTEHGAGEAAAAGEEKPNLLPDPTESATWVEALWVVIIFLILLVILYKTAWQNVLVGLKKREDRIRQDIADAEAARRRAEETLSQYNQQLTTAEGQVRDILAKATADAERIATSLRMQAQQEAEEIKERANRDIEMARKNAVSDIYRQAAELSTGIAEKILRRNLNPDDQRDLVNSSLEQLQTAGRL